MSPMLAYRRRVPPSTLMQSTSRAPELSATLSRLSCWIMVSWAPLLPGALEDLDHTPVLLPRDRARLREAHAIAFACVVRLVVRVQVVRALHRLAVAGVPNGVDDRDHDRLVHLGGDHRALADLAPGARGCVRGVVGHRHASPSAAAISRSRSTVSMRAICRRT